MNSGKQFLNQTAKSIMSVNPMAPQKRCDLHPEEEYIGICTAAGCAQGRTLVCYECIYQLHSEHSQKVAVFSQLEQGQPEGLLNLLGDPQVLQVYQKVQDYRDKYRNDIHLAQPRLQELKTHYKQVFQENIQRLQQQVDQHIDDVFEMQHNKVLYLLDALFQKHYPVDDLVKEHARLKNSNRVARQMEQLEQKVKDMLHHQEENNRQILTIDRVDEGQKVEQYLEEVLSKVKTNILQQSELILKDVKFIDDEDNHGFKPLLKLVGQDMHYNSPIWTSGLPTPDQNFEKTVFGQESIVMEDFAKLNVKQLLLESYDEQGQRRYSLLQKTKYRPLVDEFQQKTVQKLRWLDGEKSPLTLFGGDTLKDVKVAGPVWRINSQQSNTRDNFRVRLGCHFTHCQGLFDKDTAGNQCSHEIAGIGLTDDCYKKSAARFRSAGIRQFNNRNTLPEEMGQFSARLNIYGR